MRLCAEVFFLTEWSKRTIRRYDRLFFVVLHLLSHRLGPRPPDFDEVHVKCSPTFRRWLLLSPGSELVYACRTFTRGGVDEEERLMRRIMMNRRRNLREHYILQRAREAAAMEVERSTQHGRGGDKWGDGGGR